VLDREDVTTAEVEAVATDVINLLRTVRKAKARMMSQAKSDVESASQLLLHIVGTEGPMRTSLLAASAHSDLSTVSRQSAALVTAGLIERQADPADGRACLLALTPEGRETLAEHRRSGLAFFAQVLDGWTADELSQFGHLLTRFTAAYDQVHDAWIVEKAANQVASQAANRAEITEGISS
jgi:DNA-binding MarR family transcriptional regulator